MRRGRLQIGNAAAVRDVICCTRSYYGCGESGEGLNVVVGGDNTAADESQTIFLQAQQDDTREEVGLSQEAKMLGWGALMLDDHNGTAAAADAWFDWIYDTEMQTELDMTEVAMSLIRAMSQSSYRSEHLDNMPELMYEYLRECCHDAAGQRLSSPH